MSFFRLVGALVLGLTAANPQPAIAAEGSPSIVGLWQLTEYSQQFLDTKQVTKPFGDHPTGYIEYSPKGHFVTFTATDKIPAPAAPVYTDAERAAIHKGIVSAYAGTYDNQGTKVVHHVLTSWKPDWIGTDQVRFYEINGDALKVTTAPIRSTLTNQDLVSILIYKRVE